MELPDSPPPLAAVPAGVAFSSGSALFRTARRFVEKCGLPLQAGLCRAAASRFAFGKGKALYGALGKEWGLWGEGERPNGDRGPCPLSDEGALRASTTERGIPLPPKQTATGVNRPQAKGAPSPRQNKPSVVAIRFALGPVNTI